MNPKDRVAKTKVPLHLLPPAGTIAFAQACADGAAKYGPYNWREKPISLMEYLGAQLRHILALIDGEDLAADSGRHHQAHVGATAAIILDAAACGTLIDDRPAKGAASQLLEAHRAVRGGPPVRAGQILSHWLCYEHGRTEAGASVCCARAEGVYLELERRP